jgi:leader peptidase (prepilin peptidase)/N-methyltransferase
MTHFINLAVFIFGASIGSFLNVLIDRLPKEESINGRSHCDFCGKKIAWYDLIPVLSFFILKRRTRCCGKKLSLQYLLIEMLTGISFLLIFNFQFSIFNKFSIFNFQTLLLFGIISCLLVIFVSDLKYHLISDYILLAMFIFSILFHLSNNETMKQFNNFFLSGLIVSFPIFLIYFLSRERAMGLGDVYLTAIMGFLLGWQKGFLALYIAFVTGAIFGLIIILLKHKKLKSKIAFGPFLVIGTIIMLGWGEKIIEIVRRLYGL